MKKVTVKCKTTISKESKSLKKKKKCLPIRIRVESIMKLLRKEIRSNNKNIKLFYRKKQEVINFFSRWQKQI